MDVLNLVWHLLYPTALPDHSVQICGGRKFMDVGYSRLRLCKWADIRPVYKKRTTELRLRLGTSSDRTILDIILQCAEVRNGFTRQTQKCTYLAGVGGRVDISWSASSN